MVELRGSSGMPPERRRVMLRHGKAPGLLSCRGPFPTTNRRPCLPGLDRRALQDGVYIAPEIACRVRVGYLLLPTTIRMKL